jgi:hypothetical protein
MNATTTPHVLLDEQESQDQDGEGPPAAVLHREQDQPEQQGGERDLVEAEGDRRRDPPKRGVRERHQVAAGAAQPPPAEHVDRDDRRGDQQRLSDQEDAHVLPDPVQGRQRDQDRREVVAEDVVVAERRQESRGRRLEPAVVPDRLVEDGQVGTAVVVEVVEEREDPVDDRRRGAGEKQHGLASGERAQAPAFAADGFERP